MHIKDNPWRFVNVTGSPPATTTNLTNLGIGTAFRIVVRAWSEAGPGRWSDVAVLGTYGGEFVHGVHGVHVVAMLIYKYKKNCIPAVHVWYMYIIANSCMPHRIVNLKYVCIRKCIPSHC